MAKAQSFSAIESISSLLIIQKTILNESQYLEEKQQIPNTLKIQLPFYFKSVHKRIAKPCTLK